MDCLSGGDCPRTRDDAGGGGLCGYTSQKHTQIAKKNKNNSYVFGEQNCVIREVVFLYQYSVSCTRSCLLAHGSGISPVTVRRKNELALLRAEIRMVRPMCGDSEWVKKCIDFVVKVLGLEVDQREHRR